MTTKTRKQFSGNGLFKPNKKSECAANVLANVNLDQNSNAILALILKIVVSGIVIVMSSISSEIPTESLINLPPLEKALFTGTCILVS